MRRIVNIELDVRKEVHNKISFSVNQYDDVTMRAKLYDGLDEVELSDDDQIVLTVKKQDGKYVTQDANMVRENNTLIIDWSKQCSNVEGVHELELAIKDKNGLLTTAITKFMVKKPITTGVIDIINSTDDIHVLFEIKEFLEQCELALQDIADAIDAVNLRIDELKASLQGEYNKLVVELQNKKNELILEIGNKKDEFINDLNTTKNDAIQAVQDNLDIVLEQAIKKIEADKNAGIVELQAKIDEGKAILADIQQIKDTLATKQELEGVKNALQTQIDEIKNKYRDFATLEQLRDAYTHLKNIKLEQVDLNNLKNYVDRELHKKLDLDDAVRVYATHAEVEALKNLVGNNNANIGNLKVELQEYTDKAVSDLEKAVGNEIDILQDQIDVINRDFATKAELTNTYNNLETKKADKTELEATRKDLQDQINLLGGVAGKVATLQQLTDTYNYLENSKATKNEVQQMKTALETKDVELEAKINKNITDIADLNTNKADKNALNVLEQKVNQNTTDLTALTQRVTTNEADIAELKRKDADVDAKIQALEAKDRYLEAKDVQIEAELQALTGRVQTAEGDITALKAKDVQIEAKNADQDRLIAELQAKDIDLEQKINAITGGAGGYVTKPELQKVETDLDNKKADKTELERVERETKADLATKATTQDLEQVKTELEETIDNVGELMLYGFNELEEQIQNIDITDMATRTQLDNTRQALQRSIDQKVDTAELLKYAEITYVDAKDDALEQKKADKADLQALTTRVASNETNKADKTELAQAKKDLQDQIDQITGGVGGAFATKQELEGIKNTLEAKDTQLENTKADKTALDQTNAKVATIEQSVATKAEQADLTALEQRVTTNEGKITQNETDIADIKTNYVSDISIVDGMLKQTKNGNPVDVSKVITKWGDLEYVDEYKYANLYNKDAVEAGKNLSTTGVVQSDPGNLEWGVIKIPLKQSQSYTMFKKTNNNHFKISMRSADDNVVGTFISQQQGTDTNGWYRHKFDTPANTAYAYIEARLRTPNSGKDILIEGDVPASDITTEIPYLSDNRIRIQKGVTVEFDKKTSNMTSVDVNSAILEVNTKVNSKAEQSEIERIDRELALKATNQALQDAEQRLNTRIDNLPQAPVIPNNVLTSINQVAGTGGNIDLELSVNNDNLEFKVGGSVKHTLSLMTDRQADDIIALFTI